VSRFRGSLIIPAAQTFYFSSLLSSKGHTLTPEQCTHSSARLLSGLILTCQTFLLGKWKERVTRSKIAALGPGCVYDNEMLLVLFHGCVHLIWVSLVNRNDIIFPPTQTLFTQQNSEVRSGNTVICILQLKKKGKKAPLSFFPPLPYLD